MTALRASDYYSIVLNSFLLGFHFTPIRFALTIRAQGLGLPVKTGRCLGVLNPILRGESLLHAVVSGLKLLY